MFRHTHPPLIRLMTILLPENITLRNRRENLAPSAMNEIVSSNQTTSQVFLDKLSSRLTEDHIDFLKRLILGLRHEENLVEPTEHGDTTVEAECETDICHGTLHLGEEICDEEGAEEEHCIRGLHSVGSEVSWVDFGWDDPGKTCV